MPNVMVALPNVGGALYSTPQSLADAHYYIHCWCKKALYKYSSFPFLYMPCSNAAKTRNQLKFGGVPQTNETISAASGPKFTILWGHVEDIVLLKIFFPIVDMCLCCFACDLDLWPQQKQQGTRHYRRHNSVYTKSELSAITGLRLIVLIHLQTHDYIEIAVPT